MVFLYKLNVQSFGGATDTGVQNVIIFMDVFFFFFFVSKDDDEPFASSVDTASEYTGTEIGGGGGIDFDAKAVVLVENVPCG